MDAFKDKIIALAVKEAEADASPLLKCLCGASIPSMMKDAVDSMLKAYETHQYEHRHFCHPSFDALEEEIGIHATYWLIHNKMPLAEKAIDAANKCVAHMVRTELCKVFPASVTDRILSMYGDRWAFPSGPMEMNVKSFMDRAEMALAFD